MAQPGLRHFEPLLHVDENGVVFRRLNAEPMRFATCNIGYDIPCIVREIVARISQKQFTSANAPDALIISIGETDDAPVAPWMEKAIAEEFKKHDEHTCLRFYQPGEQIYNLFANQVQQQFPEFQFTGYLTFMIPMITRSLS